MKTDEILVTASLARLELDESESAGLATEISRMLEYFEKMLEVDVSGLEPTTHALITGNRFRPDLSENVPSVDNAPSYPVNTDDLLECAPDLDDRFIIIPNVL